MRTPVCPRWRYTAERNYEVRLKGATSRNVPLGDDAHGNIIRLDNGIERFAESLSLAENDLENTTNQLETAKKEVQKPFIQEEELKTKLARLDELNILLNMDKRENEIVGGEPDEGEVPNTRKEKTYERSAIASRTSSTSKRSLLIINEYSSLVSTFRILESQRNPLRNNLRIIVLVLL